jgi:hypothetical protein
MPDILILPQRGTSNNPSMHFTGSGLANIKMEVLPSGSVAYIGTSGSLFNITDSLIGSLMAVGDVSGLPIFEVFSDDRVVMGKYGKNTVYVSGANVGIGKVPLNAVLDVSGSVSVSGSLNVTSSLNLMGGAGSQLNGNGSTLSLSISGNWNSSVSSLIQLTSSDLNFWTNAGTFRFKNSSGTDVATLTNAGKLSILNGGTGTTNAPLQVAGDIVAYRGASNGVIYLGSNGDHYLHNDGTNYYLNNGSLYINGSNSLYFNTYGGGWYMQDTSWIRSAGDKSVWINSGYYGGQGGITIGYGGTTPPSAGAIISGNVGIGNSTARSPLDVTKTGYQVTGNWYEISRFVDGSSNKGFSFGYDNSSQTSLIAAHSNGPDSNISFWTYNSAWSEKIRINANGNLGIGTTSPGQKLTVVGNASISSGITANAGNDSGNNFNGALTLWDTPSTTTSMMVFKNWNNIFGRGGTVIASEGYATYHIMDTAGRGWVWRYCSSNNTSTGTNVASIRNDTGAMSLGSTYDWSNGYYAQLNISAGQGAASTYRDIDMHGSWASGEGHAITATHGGGSSNIVGQIVFQHDSPGSRIRFGRLYHSGDQSGYPMELISTGANTAKLEISGDVVADNVFNPFLLMGA